ncbi:MAG: glycoside hydrolase TIM-barrel-like domain-containing protein [Pseudomonadota bacterium]
MKRRSRSAWPRLLAPYPPHVRNAVANCKSWRLRASQRPPKGIDWLTWLLIGGRGSGKTLAGAIWVHHLATGMRPAAGRPTQPIALVGSTIHDVREVMIDGPSGIRQVATFERPIYEPTRRRLIWPNGAVAKVFSAHEPEGLRGPQFAAAWCDVFGFQPDDGSGDVYFNLDPLWASTAIDVVGIDYYAPLSDWRESDGEKGDNPDGFAHHADLAGMKTQIEAGEGYDWYFASQVDREQRRRTQIEDGAYGKPWVFRFKDIAGWWANAHVERRGGVEIGPSTLWQPKSKPVYLMEIGCTALRGGAIQPNLFPDPKSSENARPFGSTGVFSDTEQRAYITAHLQFWAHAKATFADDAPVDPDRLYAWSWDARPYPAFPASSQIWGDSDNWHAGHWLNGRLGTAPVTDLIRAMLDDHGIVDAAVGDIPHSLDGFVMPAPGDLRSVLEPIADLFDVLVSDDQETDTAIRIDATQNASTILIPQGDLVVLPDRPARRHITAQADEIPSSVSVSCRDPLIDYKNLVSIVRPDGADGNHPAILPVPGLMRQKMAEQAAHAWSARLVTRSSEINFALPLAWVGLQAGDVIAFDDDARGRRWLVDRIEIADRLDISARLYRADAAFGAGQQSAVPPVSPYAIGDFGSIPAHAYLDLPANAAFQDQDCFMVAARRFGSRRPVVFASPDGADFGFRTQLTRDALIGSLADPLGAGPTGVWDFGNSIMVEIDNAELSSVTDLAALAGANLAAIEKGDGWEVLAFARAEEVQAGQWHLSRLLRGLGGTEDQTLVEAPAGARFVLLDDAVQPAGARQSEVGRQMSWRLGEAGRPFTDRYFRTSLAAPGVRARLPLAPVHLRVARTDAGGITATWIRRSRRGGDDWAALDIPLGEETELYAVQIASAAASMMAQVAQSEIEITVDELLTAGINSTDPVEITVAQISAAVGPGLPVSTRLEQP